MERPKTNHNHLQPPQEIQQPPTTTSKTFTTNYNRIPSILKVALYSFYGARGIGTNGASYSKRIFILMRSLKTRVFECSKNASWAGSRGWIFFTIGTWIGFLFLQLLGKIIKLCHTRQKRKLILLYLVSWNSLDVYSIFPETKKIHLVET